jgi:transposase
MTGPNPVDRAKPGSKLHVLTDRAGLPLATGISAANTADGYALRPLVNAIPAIRSRRGPRRRKPAKLHGDKAYNSAERRYWLQRRGVLPRLARIGVDSRKKLGQHRWVVERSIAWLAGYRRLTIRYERRADAFKAFLALAAALTCYKKLKQAK